MLISNAYIIFGSQWLKAIDTFNNNLDMKFSSLKSGDYHCVLKELILFPFR